MAKRAKPLPNPAVRWQQLADAVLELGRNVKILEMRLEALEGRREPIEHGAPLIPVKITFVDPPH